MTPLIKLNNIYLSRGGRHIIENVSLTVNPGEHWAILDQSESGKKPLSSTMNIGIEILHRNGRLLAVG
jgi:iron complex transport system ATP-binding protein